MNRSVRRLAGRFWQSPSLPSMVIAAGRRPSWLCRTARCGPCLILDFVAALRGQGLNVETGVFQAHMEVHLVNDGPVTLVMAWRSSSMQIRSFSVNAFPGELLCGLPSG